MPGNHLPFRELADELGLSKRTITRDLQELSELGIPIYSVQGRGGGYRLLQERLLPPITFSESEAVAMFFACQSLQYFGSLPFDEGASSALHKFYHYLPPDIKEQIDRLKNKVVIWNPQRSMSAKCLRTLLQAIMIRSVVTIEYDTGMGAEKRDIQPIGLYASQGYWYCPAYCYERKGYRLFRADRVRSASLNDLLACLDEVDKKSIFDWNVHELSAAVKQELIVSLTPMGIRTLEENGWFNKFIERDEDGSGTIRMIIPVNKMSFYAEMIWGVGEAAMIIEPPEAIAYIEQKLEMISQQYRKASFSKQTGPVDGFDHMDTNKSSI